MSDEQSLDLAISSIEKEYGKGTIITGGVEFPEVERIPTGSIALDRALSGGWARGRIIEIYGGTSVGKTTIALHAIAEAQKAGLKCVFIDAEQGFDGVYARDLGIDLDQLIFSQPDNGEAALNIAETLVRTGSIGLIVIDSVAALTPREEIEGEIGDKFMGLMARMMSQAMRKLTAIIKKTNTTVIFLNQTRDKIGVFFGDPTTTTGGHGLKFAASQRVEIRMLRTVKKGEEIIGIETRLKIVKSKVGRPFKIAEIQIEFGKGIDKGKDLLTAALEKDIVNKSGAWFNYGEQKWQGENNFCEAVKQNQELFDEIKKKVLCDN